MWLFFYFVVSCWLPSSGCGALVLCWYDRVEKVIRQVRQLLVWVERLLSGRDQALEHPGYFAYFLAVFPE